MSADLNSLRRIRAEITAKSGAPAPVEEAPLAAPAEPFKGAKSVASIVGVAGIAVVGYSVIVQGSWIKAGVVGASTWAATRYLRGEPLIPGV